MTYRITIDERLCSGFGDCMELAPETFRVDGATASALMRETDDPRVLEASRACPMGAIAVEAEDAGSAQRWGSGPGRCVESSRHATFET